MSGVLVELAKRQNNYVWLLEIDGLEDTYYSSPSAPTLPPYAQPWAHTPESGVINVTAANQELDVMGSVASAGQVAVTIAITRTNSADQLMKVGRSGAGLTVTLAATLEQTGATFVEVNEDIGAWSASGILWLGREAIRYTAKTGVAPFRFTIIDADRGWFGSEQRRHIASPVEGWSPRIYDTCVTWQNRKARVLVSSLRNGGTTSDGWVEYVSGRIVSNPEISDDGLQLAINIIPHTDALNTEVGGGMLRTGLQQGFHTFDGFTAHRFQYAAGFGAGEAFEANVDLAALAGVPIPVRWEQHERAFALPGSGASTARQGIFTTASDPTQRFQVTARQTLLHRSGEDLFHDDRV